MPRIVHGIFRGLVRVVAIGMQDVPVGQRCWHFSFTPDDQHILLACGRSNEVVVIDAATLQPIKRIADKQLP